MSMRDYATEAYGLVLTEEETENLGKRYMEINEPKDYEEEDWEHANAYEFCDRIDMVLQMGNFTGEAMKILESGRDDWENSISYCGDTAFVLELNYYPNLFNKAYNSYAELISRLKEAYHKYLPEDFDYENHLRHLVGTCFG